MTLKEPLDCAVRMIPIDSLRQYYRPEETAGHCKRCPRYGMNWSCPPHDFNVTDYIFDDTLQWGKAGTPDSLYIVTGILSNATLDAGELDKVITGSCDGAMYDPRR